MTARTILQVFDQYQKSRIQFVQSIAELALRPQNIDCLNQARVLDLLKPLLNDVCTQIQQCAAIGIGRIVHHDAKLAKQILNQEFLPALLCDIHQKNKHYKKSALFVLRSLCKHNEEISNVVASSGGLEAIILCLEDFEPTVKEGAAWAIGYMAKHSRALAQCIVDAGAVPLLVLCLQEPELPLKQISASSLADIAKHSMELAQNVVDTGAVSHLARNLNNQDEKLKRQILTALSSIAKHSSDLAEVIVEAEVFPSVLIHMAHPCPLVQKYAAILVRDVVKHTLELTQLIVNTGGIGALIEALQCSMDEALIPSITAIGYIAGHSDQLTLSVIGSNGILELVKILNSSTDDTTVAVTAWTLGQIGKHSPEHAKYVAVANVFPRLLQLHLDENSSEDLKIKTRTALKQCLQKCMLLSALEPLLYDAPKNILKYVLGQFSKVLPNDPKARRLFVATGGLKKVQEIDAEPGSTLMEYITIINACFPEEIVRYFSPGYPESLLDAVEQYSPQIMKILSEAKTRDSDTQENLIGILDDENEITPAGSEELLAILKTN